MRLFVAVELPPEVVQAVERLDRPAGPDVRWSAPAAWPVTLRFLGELGEAPRHLRSLLARQPLEGA